MAKTIAFVCLDDLTNDEVKDEAELTKRIERALRQGGFVSAEVE